MARSHRNRVEVEARRELVYRLWCQRVPWQQIAASAGVSISQVGRDLETRQRQIKQEETESVERSVICRDQAIGTYENCIREAFAEWERSKQDRRRRRHKAKEKPDAGDKGGVESEAEETSEGRVAAVQLLRVVIAAQIEIDALNRLAKGKADAIGSLPAIRVVFYVPENGREIPSVAPSVN